MLNEHTLDQPRSLRLDGMLRAIEEQASSASADELGFDDRLTLLVQREVAWRDDRRVARLLKAAKLKVAGACIEEINWQHQPCYDPVSHLVYVIGREQVSHVWVAGKIQVANSELRCTNLTETLAEVRMWQQKVRQL